MATFTNGTITGTTTTATTTGNYIISSGVNTTWVDPALNTALKQLEMTVRNLQDQNTALTLKVHKLSEDLDQLKKDPFAALRQQVMNFQLA